MDDYTGWRVLVVDDSHDTLVIMTKILASQGCTIEVADSGQRALELVSEFQPDVIVLDLAMPGMSGWELHQRLRERPELDGVPVVACTALAPYHAELRAREEGFDGFIAKPFKVQPFFDEITASLRRIRGEE